MPKKIEFAQSDRRRPLSKEADVLLRNRFLEQNPILNEGVAAIQRPGLGFWQDINEGQGPIRKIFSQPGAFNDDLFVVAYNTLFRIDRLTSVSTAIDTGFIGGDENLAVPMACTGDIGDIGPRLWITDGVLLRVYLENGYATGHISGASWSDGDVVQMDTTYYKMVTGSVDTGTPAGTVGNPWLVKIGGSLIQSYTNLFNAVNLEGGTAGTDYSTATTANSTIYATDATNLGLYIRAKVQGAEGNLLPLTTTAGAQSWSHTTLFNGGNPSITLVPLPDNVGALDVAMIDNFVIVIPAQGEGINGRFFWINPGEITIDPLNYATAESSADPIYQVIVLGDKFWLLGQSTTEVWYMTGNIDSPVARFEGVVFDRGILSGTAIKIKDELILIDSDGGVFRVAGQETRISTPDIEERLRKANASQNIHDILG